MIPYPHRPRPWIPVPGLVALGLFALGLSGCTPAAGPSASADLLPGTDLSPPLVLDAGPTGDRGFSLRFDEDVQVIAGSFALEPPDGVLDATSRGAWIDIAFSVAQEPGKDYSLAGEVQDGHGNHTRFLFRFVGWNDRPPQLRLSELQTAKNSSTLHPHRDFVELSVLAPGNLGGVELEWSSSVKTCGFRFPGVEVAEGERIVLHLAPENLAEEKDETGPELALSGGIDSSDSGRDFWSDAGGLPDQSGVVVLRWRPGGEAVDGIFYSSDDHTGALAADKIALALTALSDAGIWEIAGQSAAWEDGYRWHPSVARSLNRQESGGKGPSGWYLSESGGQTPGLANAPAP